MNTSQLIGFVRHALTFIGGVLVARGIVDEETAQSVSGALITLLGFIASFVAKEKRINQATPAKR